MEHAYLRNPLMEAVETYLLSNESLKLVWAGDYSKTLYEDGKPLFHLAMEKYNQTEVKYVKVDCLERRWILNHTKRLYIDKLSLENDIHPLPLLTQETDETAGGDYRGTDEKYLGSWAHDVISISTKRPDETFKSFLPRFEED